MPVESTPRSFSRLCFTASFGRSESVRRVTSLDSPRRRMIASIPARDRHLTRLKTRPANPQDGRRMPAPGQT